jgi:sulfane dehydrogenase subunit SoxC
VKDWDRLVDSNNEEAPLSRRRFLASTTAGVASALLTTQATADTPPPEVGADLSGHGERSKFVHLAMLPEAGPGKRNVDPSDAINSKAPLGKLVGTITPTDLHYERSHSGNPDLDPAKHRLLVHGMTRKQLVLTVDDLMRMPSITRTVFIECTGNGWENWKKADPNLTVQNTHGLVSTNRSPRRSWMRFSSRTARTANRCGRPTAFRSVSSRRASKAICTSNGCAA